MHINDTKQSMPCSALIGPPKQKVSACELLDNYLGVEKQTNKLFSEAYRAINVLVERQHGETFVPHFQICRLRKILTIEMLK